MECLPESLTRKMQVVAEVLNHLAREDYKEMPTGFLLHQLRFEFWNATARMLRMQMEVEDELDVEVSAPLEVYIHSILLLLLLLLLLLVLAANALAAECPRPSSR